MGFYSSPDEKERWAKEIAADFKGIGNVVVTIKDEAVGTMDQLKVAINLNVAKIADCEGLRIQHNPRYRTQR